MPVCSRCGVELDLKQENCLVCGLHREGGKGKISVTRDTDTYKLKKIELRDLKILDIHEKLKNHKILRYYNLETITKEKIDLEVTRLSNLIKSQHKNPINPNNHFHLQKMNERKKVENALKLRLILPTKETKNII